MGRSGLGGRIRDDKHSDMPNLPGFEADPGNSVEVGNRSSIMISIAVRLVAVNQPP
jgi:hypothetical protein